MATQMLDLEKIPTNVGPALGLTAGQDYIMQNRGDRACFLAESDSMPDPRAAAAFHLAQFEKIGVTLDSSQQLWAWVDSGSGRLIVNEVA